jgi:hypothetical protein
MIGLPSMASLSTSRWSVLLLGVAGKSISRMSEAFLLRPMANSNRWWTDLSGGMPRSRSACRPGASSHGHQNLRHPLQSTAPPESGFLVAIVLHSSPFQGLPPYLPCQRALDPESWLNPLDGLHLERQPWIGTVWSALTSNATLSLPNW